MTPPCVFCDIIAGAAAAAIVHRDGGVVSFLDARPLFPGHVLVVPAAHTGTLDDLPPERIAPLFAAVHRIVRAVEKATTADGTFVAINNRVSQSVPHLHVHVVPRNKGDGLRGFFWPRHKYESPAAQESMRAAIAAALSEASAG